MKRLILSSLNKLNSAQLTKEERDAVIQELRNAHYKISDVAKAMKVSKGRVSQITSGYDHAVQKFSFYRWLSESEEIKDIDIPLTDKQKREVEILILKLKRIRGKISCE